MEKLKDILFMASLIAIGSAYGKAKAYHEIEKKIDELSNNEDPKFIMHKLLGI